MVLSASMAPLWLVARQQWTQLLRERRLRLLGILVVALCALALADSLADARRAHQALDGDMRAEMRVWEAQGAANPHGAAHFGRYVYKPLQPLAVLDPGLLAHLGSTLKLEGHVQNTSRFKATDSGAALTRFGGFSPAFAMQALVPLLIVFAAFGAFSGDRARQLLWQETGAGAAPWQLLAGRFGAFAAALLVLAGVIGVGAALAALPAWRCEHILALGLMLAAYTVYWFAFVGITLAISAWSTSARTALLAALGFWMTAAILVPMLAPALAEQRYPTPGATAFHAKVDAEVMLGPDGHSPRDVRFAALERATLASYGVARIEDLPINYSGLLFEYGERTTAAIYNRHFDRLYDDYDRQAVFGLAASVVSPLMALRPLSAALAQSDLPAHRHFLVQAEAYRYRMVQALNRDIKLNRKPGSREYASDVAAITGTIHFEPTPYALGDVLPRIARPFAILLAWLAGACILMGLAARSLERSA
jgi:ABC-2 type transport system permease protein